MRSRADVIGPWCSSGSCHSYWAGLMKRRWKLMGAGWRCGCGTVAVPNPFERHEEGSDLGWGESGTDALSIDTHHQFLIDILTRHRN